MQTNDEKKVDSKRFIGWLKEATSKIMKGYFQLPIDGLKYSIFRERVYCYELYHQLRCLMEGKTTYSLGGEVDKGKHPKIGQIKDIKNTIPDLLFHGPGYMENNLVIVEVKPLKNDLSTRSVLEDIKKISIYINEANYVKGVMLLYGDNEVKVNQVASDAPKEFDTSNIILLWHKKVGVQAQVVSWKDKDQSSVHKSSSSVHKNTDSDNNEYYEQLMNIVAPISGKKRVKPEEMMDVIVNLCKIKELTTRELAGLLGRTQETVRIHYVAKLCEQGRLQRKIPNIKNHPDQRYKVGKF